MSYRPSRGGALRDREHVAETRPARARAVEDLGYGRIWIGEFIATRTGCAIGFLDPLILGREILPRPSAPASASRWAFASFEGDYFGFRDVESFSKPVQNRS